MSSATASSSSSAVASWVLARRTSHSYVQNRTQPSIETLYKIASILDVEVDELLYSKDDIEQSKNKQ